jgi:hypothetical protein
MEDQAEKFAEATSVSAPVALSRAATARILPCHAQPVSITAARTPFGDWTDGVARVSR